MWEMARFNSLYHDVCEMLLKGNIAGLENIPIYKQTAHAAGCCNEGTTNAANRLFGRGRRKVTLGELVACIEDMPATTASYGTFILSVITQAIYSNGKIKQLRKLAK